MKVISKNYADALGIETHREKHMQGVRHTAA